MHLSFIDDVPTELETLERLEQIIIAHMSYIYGVYV